MKLRRCPKCGGRMLVECEEVDSKWSFLECWSCHWCAREMPFMWLARIVWNVDVRKELKRKEAEA